MIRIDGRVFVEEGWSVKYIKRNSRIPELLSFFFPISAITIGPYIFIKKGHGGVRLVNHEGIHVQQGKEMGYLNFWAHYLYYMLKLGWKYKNLYRAYKKIPFEIEAYENQNDLDYLATREPMAWKKYITT